MPIPDRGNGTPGVLAVAHSIPGRLRLRVPAGGRNEGLAEAMAGLPGVLSCAWAERTRSLLIRYDPGATTPDAIVAAAAARADSIAPAAPRVRRAAAAPAGPSPLGAALRDALSELNERVTRATGGMADLGALLPLALMLWAGRELARGQLAPLAWSTALWYAHGLFRDYNLPAQSD